MPESIDAVTSRRFLLGAGLAGLFAALHLYWAAGGRVGMPAGAAAISGRAVFLAYDLLSAAVFAAAALVGLRLARGGAPRWTTLATFGALFAVLRGCIGLVLAGVGLMSGRGLSVGAGYDLWFLAIGLLFLLAARSGNAWPAADSATQRCTIAG